jgi:hypothetical protein
VFIVQNFSNTHHTPLFNLSAATNNFQPVVNSSLNPQIPKMADLCPKLAGALAGAFGAVTFTFSLIKTRIEKGLVPSLTLADTITVTSTAPTPQPTYAGELPSRTNDLQLGATVLLLLVGFAIILASVKMLFEFVDSFENIPPPPLALSRTRHVETGPTSPARPPPPLLTLSGTTSISIQPIYPTPQPPSLNFSAIAYMEICPLPDARSTNLLSIVEPIEVSAPISTKNEKQYLKSLDPSSIRSKQKRNEQRKQKQLEWAAAHPNGIE